MKVSREQMQANRRRILTEASRLFRERGFEPVGVAEVMQAAGLTHGGFYGHFASKDDLIAQTVAHMFDSGTGITPGKPGLQAITDAYLSPKHRDTLARGCPTAALAVDIHRQGDAARAALSDGVERQIDRIAAAIASDGVDAGRGAAAGSWAAMVGALVLARSIDDETKAARLLDDVRSWIGDHPSSRIAEPPA